MSVTVAPYKRRNKDGSINEGGWRVDIWVKLPDGTAYRERKKPPVRSEAAALRWGQERETFLVRHGRPVETKEDEQEKQSMTFADFGAQYLADKEADGEEVKPSYLQFMRYTINGHLKRNLGTLALHEITEQRIDEMRRRMKQPRKSGIITGDTGVNKVLALLATMLRAAVAQKLLPECPSIKMLKRERKAKRALAKIKADGVRCYTEAHAAALASAACSVSRAAELIVLLGADHGLRRGEMMSLKWSDIDLENGVLTVNTSLWLHAGKVYEGTPKGGSSRELDITPALQKALCAVPKRTGYVLPRYTFATFADVVREVQRAAGFVETGKAHVLRHTFCSRLAMKGVPVKVIQTLAGHANIETTERYLHSDREQERAAMRLLATGSPLAPRIAAP